MSSKDSSTLSQLVFLEMTEDDITEKVITNTIKMLTNRKLLNKDKLDENIKKMIKLNPPSKTYKLKTNDKDIIIKITRHKMTSVGKSTDIGNFLNKNKNQHIIIIVKDINKKVRQYIKKVHPKVEVFQENELMINIVENVLVPEHEVLTQKERLEFYKSYNVKKKNMAQMLVSDPVSRYYGMKIGDICRIKRPSETDCYINSYRLVVFG